MTSALALGRTWEQEEKGNAPAGIEAVELDMVPFTYASALQRVPLLLHSHCLQKYKMVSSRWRAEGGE